MAQPDISIVTASYNTREITDKCLKYLGRAVGYARRKGYEVEVVVVDNGSKDRSAEMIAKKYPWVKLTISKVNTGFSGGNNLGMKQSSGKYILLLNLDAFVKEETLVESLEYMKRNKGCDVMGVRLLNKDGSLQPTAGYLPGPGNTLQWLLGLDVVDEFPAAWRLVQVMHPRNPGFFAKEREVGWIMGAFMFMKREVYEKTGGFDEKIFMYMEEVEWCKRMRDEGFRIWYVPSIAVTHLGQASSGFDLRKPLIREMEALPYYFAKHYPEWVGIIKLAMKAGVGLRWLAFNVLGQKERADIYREMWGKI